MVLVLLLQGCMPDSLTKFKEDSTKKEDVVTDTTPPSLLDPSGNPIDADQLTSPVSISYSDMVITVGATVNTPPGGTLNDIEPELNATTNQYELRENMENNFSVNYAITPALPAGLTLDTVSGAIFGSPVAPSNVAAYTMTLTFTDPTTNVVNTLNDTFNLTVEEEIPADFRITYDASVTNKKIDLELGDNTNFLTGVTTVTSKAGATGTLILTDSSNSIYLDVTGGEFLVGDEIDNNATFIAPESTVSRITYYFETNSTVNLVPASSSTSALDSSQNSVTYEISPDLPTGLTLNTSTGAITGTVATSVTRTEYTYKISNSTFTRSYIFDMAITEAPRGLAYTSSLLLQVANASSFSVGDYLSSNFAPPLVAGGLGEVQFVSGNNIIIRHISGTFENGQAIDDVRTYVDEETKITSNPEQVSAVLQLAAGGTANFGDYNSTTANYIVCQKDGGNRKGKATITKIDGNLMFVAQSKALSGNDWDGEFQDQAATPFQVYNEDGVDCDTLNISTRTHVDDTAGITVDNIWSPSMNLTVSSNANFKDGYDIISNNLATAYISNLAGTVFTVTPSSNTYFNDTDTLDYTRPYGAGAPVTINQVGTNLKFELKRGEEALITPFLATGEDITYTVNVDLPKGLTINEKTGVISGTPEETVANAEYQITAKNIINTETVRINLEVTDYLEIFETTNAPTYALHKTGQANSAARCRVSKEDIDEFAVVQDGNIVDIECFMDGGESDIYNLGLNFKVDAGPGICEFVSFTPFSFYQYNVTPTNSTGVWGQVVGNSCSSSTIEANDFISDVAGLAAVLPGGDGSTTSLIGGTDGGFTPSLDVQSADICQALYDNGSINCDTGTYEIRQYLIEENDTATPNGTCNYERLSTTVEVDCNGKVNACKFGAIRDVFSKSEIEDSNITTQIVPSDSGITKEYEFKSPISQGHVTNRRLVNQVMNNQCSSETSVTTYNYDDWRSRSASTNYLSPNNITDPFMGANPYYTFNCLDGAYDLKARIRIVVRDWDRNFDKSSNIDSYFASFINDSSLDPFGISYNNRADWDNQKPTYQATCASAPIAADAFAANALSGTISSTAGSATITGAGTNFTGELSVGDWIRVNTEMRQVTAIGSATSMTVNLVLRENNTNITGFDLTGTTTLAYTIGTNTLTGAGTAFLSTLAPGVKIRLGSGQTVIVDEVNSNTVATIKGVFEATNGADGAATLDTGLTFPDRFL
jgi:hypothetical protein